ncbi:MAG: hypothetical protein IKS90_07295 [Clostridia bacterium]|nr:hypothetical protein [Clostridia bacterium]
MLTYEQAMYHKLLLEAGMTDETNATIEQLIEDENPLSDVATELAYAGKDINKLLSALNAYLEFAPIDSIDMNAVFDQMRIHFFKAYESAPDDLGRLINDMYRVSEYAFAVDAEYRAPWWKFSFPDDNYSLYVADGYVSEDEFRVWLKSFLTSGETEYEWIKGGARNGGIAGFFKKLFGIGAIS